MWSGMTASRRWKNKNLVNENAAHNKTFQVPLQSLIKATFFFDAIAYFLLRKRGYNGAKCRTKLAMKRKCKEMADALFTNEEKGIEGKLIFFFKQSTRLAINKKHFIKKIRDLFFSASFILCFLVHFSFYFAVWL